MHPTDPESNFPQPGASWLRAPDERSADFFPAFARISVALQQALRERVPSAYFENVESYRDTKRAYPMLLYRASRPFRARMRTELTYDVLNPANLARIFRSARQSLPELLANAENRLKDAGWFDIARHYQPKRAPDIIDSVQRLSKSRRCLYVLIRAESLLLNGLIDLGGSGSPKQQQKRTAGFEKRWTFQLRRLYPGMDFYPLAPALMQAATRALTEFLEKPSAPDDPEVLDPMESDEPSDYST